MARTTQHIRLSEGESRHIRFMSDRVDAHSLSEQSTQRWVTVTRTGTFHDPRYGQFDISREMLLSMVANFKANVYGQEIVIDLSHKPQEGAAGFVRELRVEGGGNSAKLRALVEFTAFGIDAVKKKGFIYLSAEFAENFTDNEQRKEHGPTLLGAALTPRPVIKHLDRVELSLGDLDRGPYLISDRIVKILAEETRQMNKYIEMLRKAMEQKKLSENLIKQLCEALGKAGAGIEDADQLKELTESFITTGAAMAKQLTEAGQSGDNVVLNLSVPAPTATGLDEAGVRALMEQMNNDSAAATRKLAEDQQARVDQFTTLLSEAKLEGLSEEESKLLSSAADLITANTTEAQVIALATQQIALGNQLAVNKQLAGMGFNGPQGSVRISVDETNSVKALQEQILVGLRGSYVHGNGGLLLAEQEKEHPFVTKVLAVFDSMMAPRLAAEHKALAAGTTGIGDTSLPAGFQRTVIREALSDTRVLELVQTLTDSGATATTDIPYETRDTSGVNNDGIVFEGQGIHRASVTQAMDLAYILPMKLAFLISNEVIHFTRASAIDWDAYARNVESNARVMRELIVRRICNEIQRSSDAYLAADIANEGFDAQLDGATVSTIKTVQFPIVRQHQQYDLKGTAVGSAENPITVRLDGVAISAYDGTGDQAAATYYRITNYNLGYVQFVSELGVPVTPPNAAGADDITYSYSTNVAKFDLDNGTTNIEVHLNGLMRTIGARKAVMSSDRYVTPDFALMSHVLNDTCSNAEMFAAERKRDGVNTNGQGDLDSVKGIGAWSTNAPGVDLGDERIILGQRGTCTYTVAKPFITGQPFEAVNAVGNPTGQKQAYGEEYSAIKVPTPIRNRFTSVLAYSAGSR